ncbi:DUF6508 domain-containing protein [Glycomyces buryatensis]|uniref:Uncharacterized protein n=1 Tax=Glycomyces buryatensis TaxID=2570927 RepID=A0A4S8QC56_9ACTN|nr:DUF6508 domain-containing protein [Glycomyces buryatensis]THV41161.1 hypothetical protein FAB82_12990 [Glycomyces buryatensis]
MTADSSEPTDDDIVAGLAAAPAEAWERLIELANHLTDADMEVEWSTGQGTPDEPLHFPYPNYSPAIGAIHHQLYEVDAVTSFNWPAWFQENPQYRDPAAIAAAGPAFAARVATVVIRRERFSEGSLQKAMETGVLAAILERLTRWYTVEREQ